MGDNREKGLTFLIRYKGKNKSIKVELFPALQWNKKINQSYNYLFYRYRVRTDGKWFNPRKEKYTFFTKWEIRDLLWKSIKF